jgi:hypothetical protein
VKSSFLKEKAVNVTEILALEIDLWEVKIFEYQGDPALSSPYGLTLEHEGKNSSPFVEIPPCGELGHFSKSSFTVILHPFFCDRDVSQVVAYTYIKLCFNSLTDLLRLKKYLVNICLIAEPRLEENYTFEKNLGKGSQATVDLYIAKMKKPVDSAAGVGPSKP